MFYIATQEIQGLSFEEVIRIIIEDFENAYDNVTFKISENNLWLSIGLRIEIEMVKVTRVNYYTLEPLEIHLVWWPEKNFLGNFLGGKL